MEHGVKKLFVMLLLDPVEHSSDLDPWPWGGESIYRNDEFCGTVGNPKIYMKIITNNFIATYIYFTYVHRLQQPVMDFLWVVRSALDSFKTSAERMGSPFI